MSEENADLIAEARRAGHTTTATEQALADALEASQAELAELRVENARLRVAGEPLRRANRKARAAHDREVSAKALEDAGRAWLQGEWAGTPRRGDRIADRMAASQFAGDWMKDRAAEYRNPEGNEG